MSRTKTETPDIAAVQPVSYTGVERRRAESGWCFVLPWSLPNLHGGVNQVVNNLLSEMIAGHLPEWRPLGLETDWQPRRPEHLLPCQTPLIHTPLRVPLIQGSVFRSTLGFILHLPAELMRLRRIAKRYNVRVFNIHFPGLDALHFVLLRKLGLFSGRVILSLHGSDIRTAHKQQGLTRWLWKGMLRSADLVVACSEGLREEALMLEPGARVVTVHNGIDVNRFLAESTRSFEWPPALKGRKVIIQVGSFQHRKGHDLLVEAFQSVRQRHPETALLLVGSTGAEGDAVRRLVCQLGLQNSVWLFENVPHEQILGILARCDLFVLCSRWEKGVVGEGFAIALLEAAVAGLPVVATASCGVPEIIKDRVTGLLVPLEDTDAIGRAICEMIENTDLAYRTAANLSRLVAEEFTWSRAVKAYLSLAG